MPTTITYEVILKTEYSDMYGHSENTIATITVPAKESGGIGETLRNAVLQAITNIKNKEKTNEDIHA